MHQLYHTTPAKNVASIRKTGIRLHNGVIWLHIKTATEWALHHLAKHHNCEQADMVTIRVHIDHPDALQYAGGTVPGRYLCFKPIPPENLHRDLLLEE